MDLENDFYLVQLKNEDDYNRVLVGEPWVIYGQYLTVRSWTPDFSSANTRIEAQVVWIRLFVLPKGY